MAGILPSSPDAMHDARTLAGDALAAALRDSRARTLSLVDDLSDAQWRVPCLAGVNPIAWELLHIAWFAEFWILRGPHRVDESGLVHADRPPRHAGPDHLLDSARLPHAARWNVEWPARSAVASTLAAQLDACIDALPATDDDSALYFHRLALFHEDMHAEAFTWLRASLGYPAPSHAALPRLPRSAPLIVRGGPVRIGWPAGRPGFAFDNEQPGRAMVLDDFDIDAAPVTAGQFIGFVEAGGYEDMRWWPGEAGEWLAAHGPRHAPERWRRASSGEWQQRWFDRWIPVVADEPVVHVCAWEAQAYARWAGRRLPHAAEWEHAAATAGPAFEWGRGVWEWTADAFQPYPAFEPGPYRDYSAPWFGNHRELRGGAFATHDRLHDVCYRNFFMPHRSDVFAGFRTASGAKTA